MKQNRKLTDLLLLVLSAWAVVATSQRKNLNSSDTLTQGIYTAYSNCDNAALSRGDLTVTEDLYSDYSLSNGVDYGFPSNSVHEIYVDANSYKGAKWLNVDGDSRFCQATVESNFFDTAEPIDFLCYDNQSKVVSCTITLKLQSLEEVTKVKDSPSEAASPSPTPTSTPSPTGGI